MRRVVPLLIIGLITLSLLAVAEVAVSHTRFRAPGLPNPPYDIDGDHLCDFRPGANAVSSFKGERPFRYLINAEGCRTTFEYDLKPVRPAARVLFLGDSFTFGSWVNDDQTTPYQFGTHFAPEAIEVINAGGGGFSIQDELEYWTEKGRRFTPDLLVLIVYVGNDLERAIGLPARASRPGSRLIERLRRPLSDYALYNFAGFLSSRLAVMTGRTRIPARDVDEAFIRGAHEPASPYPAGGDWENYSRIFGTFVATVQQDGVPLLVVIYPHRAQVDSDAPDLAQQRLLVRCTEVQAACLDLLPLLRAEQARGIYPLYHQQLHNEDDHPSAAGHALTAAIIAQRVMADSAFAAVARATRP